MGHTKHDCIHVRVKLIKNLYIMNTSFNEHFLKGPVGVHYREVLLYIDKGDDGNHFVSWFMSYKRINSPMQSSSERVEEII